MIPMAQHIANDDENGNLLSEMREDYYDYSYELTYGYDEDGNLLSEEYDWDGDGEVDESYHYEYDADGNVIYEGYMVDGATVYASSYTYDAEGNMTSALSESDWDDDGVFDQESYTFEYDANGNMVGESYEDSGEVLISMSTTKMAMFSMLKCLNPMTGMMMV